MTRRTKANDRESHAAHELQDIPSGPKIDHARLFPGLRLRHDGWTVARTQRFLDTLAHTGCIEDACRVAGMSDVGARRMYAKYPEFAQAWDDALARAQKGLIAIAYQRAVEGRETVIIRKGVEYERRIAPSDAMLGLLVKRGDLVGKSAAHAANPEEVITLAEWEDSWRFDDDGKKYRDADYAGAKDKLIAKLEVMQQRYFANADKKGVCVRCGEPLRRGVTNAVIDQKWAMR